jgi:succinyl-CoA synthetase beta subunit
MKLPEYQGKELFQEHGISIPWGAAVRSEEAVEGLEVPTEEAVIKAQVLLGGRGKAGGIRVVRREKLRPVVAALLGSEIRGFRVEEVLVEEKIEAVEEWYLSLTIDPSEKSIVAVYSEEGGVEIEEVARKSPEKILRFPYPGRIPEEIDPAVVPVIETLYRVMRAYDAELVEINPLAKTRKGLVALDAKILIDDNALFRHPEFQGGKVTRDLTPIEAKAQEYGLLYVELEGDIAVIGNGAGLVMATLDVLEHFGGRPANFLDVGGGASVERMEKALEVVLMKGPRKVFINIFGGITRCDEIAEGIVRFRKSRGIRVPIIVRMIGTREEEAKEILEAEGIDVLDSLEEGARKAVEADGDSGG